MNSQPLNLSRILKELYLHKSKFLSVLKVQFGLQGRYNLTTIIPDQILDPHPFFFLLF